MTCNQRIRWKVKLNALDLMWLYLTFIWLYYLNITVLKLINFSCDLSNDKNPLDELFNVLNPTFKIGKPRYVERDLPDSFFNPKPRTFNPKREEAIRKEQIRHFQSLRRTRNPSSDKDKTKIEKVSLVINDHGPDKKWLFTVILKIPISNEKFRQQIKHVTKEVHQHHR